MDKLVNKVIDFFLRFKIVNRKNYELKSQAIEKLLKVNQSLKDELDREIRDHFMDITKDKLSTHYTMISKEVYSDYLKDLDKDKKLRKFGNPFIINHGQIFWNMSNLDSKDYYLDLYLYRKFKLIRRR